MEGWAKFHRQLLSHHLWLSEPFTRGQAWVDLFSLASHSPSHFRVRGIRVDVGRGQLAYSELTLATRWKWSRGKVRRFLRELENDQMLATKQDNKTTIITILNYDKYQGGEMDSGTANETAGGTPDGHQTGTYKNEKNEKKKDITPPPPLQGEYTPSFLEFWSAYPNQKGKAAAFKAWKAVPKKVQGVTVPQIIAAIKAQVEADHFRGQDGNLFIPHPATWLNQGRWDDSIKPIGPASSGMGIEQLLARQNMAQGGHQ